MFRAPVTAGELLQVVRGEVGATRASLGERTGMSRMAVEQRLSILVENGLVVADGLEQSTGGRPPAQFRFNSEGGVVVAVDIGISAVRVALADLAGDLLMDVSGSISIEDGPEVVLGLVEKYADELIAKRPRPVELWGMGIGVPGPVEFEQGRVVAPPFMPGWDRYPIRDWATQRFGCPTVVDKDANIMALGEFHSSWSHLRHILFVKAGTGVGCGIITDGRIYRGANGAAGDLGHIEIADGDEIADGEAPTCRCGNVGCVEAMAGGWALVRDLRNKGIEVTTAGDVARMARAGDPGVLAAIRKAGRILGHALADAVNFFNPSVLVIGGAIGQAHGELLAGVREVVYRRSLTLATSDLQIVPSALAERAGVVGAAHLIGEQVMEAGAVDARLAASTKM